MSEADLSIPRLSPLIDSHAHLASRGLRDDLDGVIDRAKAAGLVGIVAIGTTLEDSEEVVREIARSRPGVFATVGIHPNDAAVAGPDDWARIRDLAREPGVVAIGETGLDRYRDRTPFSVQQEFFDRHLDLAEELGLPVVIHCRQSEGDIVEQLTRRGRPVRGILHSFVGDSTQLDAFLQLGLHISIAGQVTFANKTLDSLRQAVASIPEDRLLFETDSPFLSPEPLRGKPNEPGRVAFTARRIAEIRGGSAEALAAATTANATRLFGLNSSLADPS